MSRYKDADALKERLIQNITLTNAIDKSFSEVPTLEPNRILPEQMERGDIYEVGETIVVMNHDDYYDLLCKSIELKHEEWVMTMEGVLAELVILRDANDVPAYYKGRIEKVIETIVMELAGRIDEPQTDYPRNGGE